MDIITNLDTSQEVLEISSKKPSANIFSADEFIDLGLNYVPYVTKLSFLPLINSWREKLKSEQLAERVLAEEIITRVEANPIFLEPIEDISLLENHQDIVELLIAGLFPISLKQNHLGKVGAPFQMSPFYLSPALNDLMSRLNVNYKFGESVEIMKSAMAVRACSWILNKVYGQNINVDPNMVLTLECPLTHLQMHFTAVLHLDFVEVKVKGKPKKLSQQKINSLISNIHDKKAWLEALPPEKFEIHGMVGATYFNISEREILSTLKNSLLQKNAISNKESIKRLEFMFQSYFMNPELKIGLTALDYPPENAIQHEYKIRFNLLADKHKGLLAPENRNSIYEKACRYREIITVEDLKELKFKTHLERDLIEMGIQSIMIAPLTNMEDQVIGILEVASPKTYGFHSFSELKLKDIVPLFNVEMERSREEIDNQIEAIIRERFTTIHPSVEWKFIESAFQMMEEEEGSNKRSTPKPILFENVYPLYGQADIVSSSTTRNRAIQADFIENLNRIRKVLQLALNNIDFPILHHYLLETEHLLEELKEELKSNDENRIMDFIKNEIHEVLQEIAKRDSEITFAVAKYFSELDNSYGVIYNERKKYEDSVAMINETLSDYIESEDLRLQKMIPHYFEKYKTDGVEYEIYAGQSILRNQTFNQVHLKNMRLSQLITMCHVTQKMNVLRAKMPVPLSTAQLIFVYSNPISVRFRMDDKHFDVDGAYNIRYEIIKKRIDKAYIDGTTERLTQKGKIAIVYTADKDKNEYMEYLVYLLRQDLIEDNIEELTLGKLQGVQGLRALRVTVKV